MESAKLRLDQPIRTSKRKKEARSPQQQRDMAAMCAKLNGYEIVKVHDSGRNESGKTMDRASLNAIMERIRAGLTDGVIVALTDRLGRAPIEEAMTWINELHAAGGALVLADAGGSRVSSGRCRRSACARRAWAR
jgi:DNA invertase Pin-like site-specific DNA recombinase